MSSYMSILQFFLIKTRRKNIRITSYVTTRTTREPRKITRSYQNLGSAKNYAKSLENHNLSKRLDMTLHYFFFDNKKEKQKPSLKRRVRSFHSTKDYCLM